MKTEYLRNIANIQTGPFGSQLHKNDYVEVGTPIVTVEHLGRRAFTEQNLPKISDEDKNRLIKYILKEGDIVFSRVGSVDRCSYVGEEHAGWMFSGRCLRVRAVREIESQFLYYFFCLNQTKEFIRNIAVGATMPSINTKLIGEVKVTYPSIIDQKKIILLPSLIDDLIELKEKINKNLIEQLKFLFIDKIINNPKIDFVTQIPLVDLCSVITKGTTPTTLGKAFTSTGINFLKVESISELHSFDKSKFAHIDLETHKLLKRSIIKNKDILFTIAGTLGRFALVNNSILPANTNQAIAIIRANPKKISPEYLFSCLIGNWHNDYYSKRIQQSVQANLSLTTIKSLPIPVLQEKDMEDYLAIVNPIINMLDHISSENEYLLTIRDTLLPKLMSGEIDISNIKV